MKDFTIPTEINKKNKVFFSFANANREPTYRRTRFNWEFPYYVINQANNLIIGVTESSLGETDKAELIAQGRTLRAFMYFQLAMDYQSTYSENPSAPAPSAIQEAPINAAEGF